VKRSILIPAILVLAPAAYGRSGARLLQSQKQAADAATLVLQRDGRGRLKAANRSCVDLSAPNAFVSDDTVRAKPCRKVVPAKKK
jgi:hypothetical protein